MPVPRRPNIVFVTTDHLRYDTLGCNGDPIVKTPHIDGLAREGVNFHGAFAQNPVCGPSRATMITGRYPSAHGVKWNFSPLHEWEVPFTEVLKEAGYSVAVIGKDHVRQQRYEKSIDHAEARSIRNSDPRNPFVQYVNGKGYTYLTGFDLPEFVERMGAVPREQPDDCHLDAFVGGRAVDYIQRYRSDQPFFLWVGFYGPHHPYVPTGRFAAMYDADDFPEYDWDEDDLRLKPPEYRAYREWDGHKFAGFDRRSEEAYRHMKAAYYGTVSLIDWQVGLLVEALRAKGVYDETVIVFTSDHGDFLGDHKMPAKGPFLLDSLLHVPLIVKPDSSIAGGREDSALRELVDLYPTIVEFAGRSPARYLQGKSLLAALRGSEKAEERRRYVYAEMVNQSSLRSHDWKLIHYPGKPYGELYDVRDDPGEKRNLYDERPDKVEAMRGAMWEYRDARVVEHYHPHFMTFDGRDPQTGESLTHYGTW